MDTDRNNPIDPESCMRFTTFITYSYCYTQLQFLANVHIQYDIKIQMLLSVKYLQNLYFSRNTALFQLKDTIHCRHYLKSTFSLLD